MKKLPIVMLFLFELSSAQMPNLLKDISPGSASSSLYGFTTLANNDVIFYTSTATPTTNTGVWVTNGSTAGTVLLRNLFYCSDFIPYQSKHYFGVRLNGQALWRTDGTFAGTDSLLTPGIIQASGFRTANNTLFFQGHHSATSLNNNSLWRSDGTALGTYSLVDNTYSGLQFYPSLNNVLLFSVTSSSLGTELWRSDGTASGTYMLKDIWSGAGSSSPIALGIYNNMLFFTAIDPVNGRELWRTDGTAVGTILLKDIFPGTASGNLQRFNPSTNGAYFFADNSTQGNELWFSDGSSANTQMVQDLTPGSNSTFPFEMTFFANNAYFLLSNKLYKTNGTSAGTSSISIIPSYSIPSSAYFSVLDSKPYVLNNEIYFGSVKLDSWTSATDTVFLNKSDPNLNTLSIVSKIHYTNTSTPFPTGNRTSSLVASRFLYHLGIAPGMHDLIIFNTITNQNKIYHSLGYNNPSSILNSIVFYNQPIGSKLYFPYQNNDSEPGYINLNNDSLYLLKNIKPSGTSFDCPSSSTVFTWRHGVFTLNNRYYFMANNPNYGVEFFETDFTPNGTFMLKDINPGIGDFYAHNNCQNYVIHQTSNNIYFIGNDGASGNELWSFINSPNNPPPPPTTTTSINEDLYFTQGLNIFPNPVERTLNVESTENIRDVLIFNALGEVVTNTHIELSNTSAQIDLQNFSNGIYFARITTNKGQLTKKFIKGD